MDTTQQFIKDICVNYNSAEKCIAQGRSNESAQYIRAALENAVTLFWNKKNLGTIPIKNGKIDLVAAIADSRFRFNFFDMTIWKDIGPDFPGYHNDMTTRLTFIKCSYTNNKYAFGGIYKPTKLENRTVNGKVYHVKVYERIAETYGE